MSPRLHAWLELFRVPNLPTVPGDPLAGACLAAAAAGIVPDPARLGLAAGVSLLLYMAGLALNDVADAAVDRVERPGRPIPSGRITRAAAAGAGVVLMGAALAVAAGLGRLVLAVAGALAATILAYNLGAKRAVVGPAVMGLCRGLSVAVGAVAASGTLSAAAVGAAAGMMGYVTTFSFVARHEMRADPVRRRGVAPPLVLFLLTLTLVLWTARFHGALGAPWLGALIFTALANGMAVQAGLAVLDREPVPPAVGRWIGALLPVQAAIVTASGVPGSWGLALALGLAWPANLLLRRTFAAS